MRDPFEELDVSERRAILIVAVAIVATIGLTLARPTAMGTVAVILAFFVMIMLHELGHFVMAKRAGMKVTEFFVGFGPRLWSVRRGETEYGIKVFPLGGYCKIVGMTNLDDVAPDDEPRAYRSKSFGAKVTVAAAGSAMHFLIAIAVMFVVLWGKGDLPSTRALPTISEVMAASPAERAGIRAGDRLVAVAGVPIHEWGDVPDLVRARGGESVPFVVERDGVPRTLTVRVARENPAGERAGYAGVAPTRYVPPLAFYEAAYRAPVAVAEVARASVVALGEIFSPSGIRDYVATLTGTRAEPGDDGGRFLSPVGFGRVASQAVESGWVTTMGLLISINTFIGIFNLVPLLPFDGGHLAIATYEKIASTIRRRRVQVDVAKLLPLTVAVIGVLGLIFLSSLFLDLSRPIPNPF